MDPGLQGKLLTVIEEHECRRVGGDKPQKTNARVLASTNKRVETIDNGGVREDLWYRFFPIEILPLRERMDDVIPIIDNYLTSNGEHTISDEAKNKLMSHNYPGNVRELESVLYMATISARIISGGSNGLNIVGDDIAFDRYSLHRERQSRDELPVWLPKVKPVKEALDVCRALERTDFNYTEAAKIVGIEPRTFYRRVYGYFGTNNRNDIRDIISGNI
jgi:DNA-binding NtrC family response regulator